MAHLSSHSKMAAALVREDPASAGIAESIVRSQKECVLCGHGIIVKAWGEYVRPAERVILESLGADGIRRSVAIHAGCLTEVSAGTAIAEALGLVEPEA
jgi:hypothetical protein